MEGAPSYLNEFKFYASSDILKSFFYEVELKRIRLIRVENTQWGIKLAKEGNKREGEDRDRRRKEDKMREK